MKAGRRDMKRKFVFRKTVPIKGSIHDYEEKQFGVGGFSSIHRCKKNGDLCVKVITKAKNGLKEKLSLPDLYLSEVVALTMFGGLESAVSLHAVYEDETYLYLVMDRFEGSDVYDFVKQWNPAGEKFTADEILEREETFKPMIRKTLELLKVMHEHNVVHGDIKQDNMLRNANGGFKVIDFGLVDIDGVKSDEMGTLIYMAPEIYLRKPKTLKSDIWSLGVSMWTMLTQHFPFGRFGSIDKMKQNCIKKGDSKKEAEERVQRVLADTVINGVEGESDVSKQNWFKEKDDYDKESKCIGPKVTNKCRHFLTKCFDRDPRNRWSASMLLELPWLKDACSMTQTQLKTRIGQIKMQFNHQRTQRKISEDEEKGTPTADQVLG